MPELSQQQRLKMVTLEPGFARTPLVRALELGWELHFKCVWCLATRTWRRDTLLGRARAHLGLTMAELQKRAHCPRCGARMPAMSVSGVLDPGPQAEALRWAVIAALHEAGLNPDDYGYGWRRPAGRA